MPALDPEPTAAALPPQASAPTASLPSRPHLRLLPPPAWTEPAPDFLDAIPGQQALALEYLLPNGLPAVPADHRQQVLAAPEPDITPWAARLAQAVLEVEAAERPVGQLSRWVVPEIYRRLDRRQQLRARQVGPRGTRTRTPEHVRSVHVCHPRPDVAEVSVVTVGTDRCRALALRLERRRERWMCTALDWA
jgi:hypothetical protein